MDDSQNNYAKWKKLDTKGGPTVWFHVHEMILFIYILIVSLLPCPKTIAACGYGAPEMWLVRLQNTFKFYLILINLNLKWKTQLVSTNVDTNIKTKGFLDMQCLEDFSLCRTTQAGPSTFLTVHFMKLNYRSSISDEKWPSTLGWAANVEYTVDSKVFIWKKGM